MLCFRCLIPLLAYLMLEQISAAVLPSSLRSKREINWPDQEIFQHHPDGLHHGDLSVGDTGDIGKDVGGHPPHPETLLVSAEPLHLHRQHQNHHHFHRKTNEKRRKVAPLDSIGSFQMSSFRNRKDEPDSV